MPRKSDPRERRELLADALMRLAATRGLEGVSLRHVASEAGVSTGMVQHYFRTKDEMMTFALDTVMDRIRERSQAEVTPASPRELVRGLLLQLLPLDDASVKPSIASGLRQAATDMRTFLADQLRAAGPANGVDPERAAAGLLALVDGLGLQLLSRQYAEENAVAALDAQLALLFGLKSS
jgi:AcrR family transcriptional regulator